MILITNVLYLKIIDPSKGDLSIHPFKAKIKFFYIKFSLLFLPIFDEVEKHVFCKAFYFEEDLNEIDGKIVSKVVAQQ